jgi:hypothetical protein
MDIYDFSTISRTFFCGTLSDNEESFIRFLCDGMSNGIETPVHPKEIERQERMCKRKGKRMPMFSGTPKSFKTRGNGRYDNSVIFISGGAGFGTKDDDFFGEVLGKINNISRQNNSYVVIVRGSKDDPSYFTEHKFDLSNVKLVPDYSVIRMKGFDVLCVGGGLTIDRQWRIEQGKRLGKTLYFEGCRSVFDDKSLSDVLNDFKIACVVTTDAPTFVPPSIDLSNSSKWVANDKDIISDMTAQRLVMDRIYNEMTRLNKKPYIWCHNSSIDDTNSTLNNIRYISSSTSNVIFDAQDLCVASFGIGLDGEKCGKKIRNGRKQPSSSCQNLRNPFADADVPHIDWFAAPNNLRGEQVRRDEEGRDGETMTLDGGAALGDVRITTEAMEEAVRRYNRNNNFDNLYYGEIDHPAEPENRLMGRMGRYDADNLNAMYTVAGTATAATVTDAVLDQTVVRNATMQVSE